ncbi:MAG: isoprenylcysteine carboxylmethyltransferase family protein [Alphaproteobacteria bacterium]|nr:isoprenylcysteine carboxylmethyltransferase family protein [Alphaproteobacteria bacterium]MCL2505652.1 isoprenylcysteine carboxylmethyltransferase family protein [Alphaproteobacteria bacterium]
MSDSPVIFNSERRKSMWRWFKAILLLPINTLVIIPGIILIAGDYDLTIADKAISLTLGIMFLLAGLLLALWTIFLFHTRGHGTAAPWDPPTKLVIHGPYKHVRNPMITSVFFMLAAEVLITHSIPILIWACIFVVVNLIYLPLFEEKELEKRFGNDYKLYKRNVPRWLPRLTPWSLPG